VGGKLKEATPEVILFSNHGTSELKETLEVWVGELHSKTAYDAGTLHSRNLSLSFPF
jgi:hypothetical protein